MADNQTADTDEDEDATESDSAILDEARKRYRMCQDADSDNRINALDDLNFLTGGEAQWDARAVAARKADGRPIITVNTLPTYLHQVTNDQRQNTPSIKVHPVGDGADVETAKVRQGMIRHIEYDSNADIAYDTAVNSSAAIGFGYWRLITDWESPTSFNQKIMYQRIRNALSVKTDPLAVQADGSDMQFCFIECVYPRDEFKREWPETNASDPSFFNDGSNQYVGWLSDTTVLVCEYYRIEKTEATVVLLSNGESGFEDDLIEMPPGVTVTQKRDGERSKVMLYKITGADILEKTEIKCRWIPVFPVYGDEVDIEGKVIRSGIVRNAKGPAQSYNVFITGATEEIALRTKNPWIGAEGQFATNEDQWAQANNRAFPYLEYDPVTVDGKLAPPPQRQPMADVPAGMLAMAMHSRDNVKATTGLFDSSLGARGTATSGIQEREQQQQGDMANFHYMDGLLRSIRHCGRCIDCMIPNYYDAARVVKIMRDDNTMEHAQINQPQNEVDEEGNAIQSVLNDMTCGEYDVTVEAGPAYSTMREESADAMGEAMNKNPALWGVFGDLYVKSRDWPNAQEIAERVAKTIPPQIRGPEEGDESEPMVQTPQGPVPSPQAGQMIADLMAQLQQATEAVQKADAAKQQAEVLKQQHLIGEQQLEPTRSAVEVKRLDAEIAKANAASLAAQADAIKAEADLIRAQAEAGTAPIRAEAEVHTSRASVLQAENELRQPVVLPKSADELAAEKEDKEAQMLSSVQRLLDARPMPKGMTIKAPSGLDYEVTLH